MDIKNWRERRRISYNLFTFDDVNLEHVYNSYKGDELVDQVVMFFVEGSQLIYPAKSYYVALIYAAALALLIRKRWLQDDSIDPRGMSEEDIFFKVLDFPDLLPDDKYFVRYSEDEETYQKIVAKLKKSYVVSNRVRAVLHPPSVHKTLKYFSEEFLIPFDNIFSEEVCYGDVYR